MYKRIGDISLYDCFLYQSSVETTAQANWQQFPTFYVILLCWIDTTTLCQLTLFFYRVSTSFKKCGRDFRATLKFLK